MLRSRLSVQNGFAIYLWSVCLPRSGELEPMQIQNSVGNIFGLGVGKFSRNPTIPEEGRLSLKTLYLQDKHLHMAAKDKGGAMLAFKGFYFINIW